MFLGKEALHGVASRFPAARDDASVISFKEPRQKKKKCFSIPAAAAVLAAVGAGVWELSRCHFATVVVARLPRFPFGSKSLNPARPAAACFMVSAARGPLPFFPRIQRLWDEPHPSAAPR